MTPKEALSIFPKALTATVQWHPQQSLPTKWDMSCRSRKTPIRAALSDARPLSSYSAKLVKTIVTVITLHADQSVNLTLKNGQQVRKERSDGEHKHSA